MLILEDSINLKIHQTIFIMFSKSIQKDYSNPFRKILATAKFQKKLY